MQNQAGALEPIVQFSDVFIEYRARAQVHAAVRGVSFSVGASQAVGIVGESGSGKSTVARALIGLLPVPAARITSGRISIRGTDITNFTEAQWVKYRGNPIAMIFQDPLSYLNPIKKIGQQIAETVRRHSPGELVDRRTAELLDIVQLPRTVHHSYAYQLSGGMRQRVLIAIAIACRPAVLLADEPTTALDPTTQIEILKLIRSLRGQFGMSLVLISHDLEVVASECDYINVMYQGELVEAGPSRKIFTAPEHPYTDALLRCARAELTSDGRFVTIDREDIRAKSAARRVASPGVSADGVRYLP